MGADNYFELPHLCHGPNTTCPSHKRSQTIFRPACTYVATNLRVSFDVQIQTWVGQPAGYHGGGGGTVAR
jgi:hypothetical protein